MSLLGDLGTAIKNKLGGASVDNTVPRYNGTTCTLQSSEVTISDTNVVTASGGFVGNLTGNASTAASATKLATARSINGVAFDGTANITIADDTKVPLNGTGASGTWGISITGNSNTATSATTATNVSGGKATVHGTGNDYHLGGVELVGNGPANTVFPTIGFHQPALYASSLQLRGGGDFRFYTQGGGSYANVTANTFIGNLSGNAETASHTPTLSALQNYVWSAGTTPTGYPLGVQTSFVNPEGGFPDYGSVVNVKTYSGGGGSLQLYVPYGPTNGGNTLKVRFGNYNVNSGNSWTNWKTLITDENISSYSAGSAGGSATFTASGTWTCPAGVYTAFVRVLGGGGGGGGTPYWQYGSGGGGGAAVENTAVVKVTPGTGYTITIGAGGAGSTGNGGAGGNSSAFGIIAYGGGGGGAGGTSGGEYPTPVQGGSGGSSAYPYSSLANGSISSGGCAIWMNAVSARAAGNVAATLPGQGGGGSLRNNNSAVAGRAGFRGEVYICW